MKEISGKISGRGFKFAIIVSRFNNFITERLLEGALDCLGRHEVSQGDIAVWRTPGSFEIPAVARRLSESGEYDGIICLGAVIRGGTRHNEYISTEVVKGIAQVSMQSPIPVCMGVLTTDTIEEAVERAGTKLGNKGFDTALSAIEMVNLYASMKGEGSG